MPKVESSADTTVSVAVHPSAGEQSVFVSFFFYVFFTVALWLADGETLKTEINAIKHCNTRL